MASDVQLLANIFDEKTVAVLQALLIKKDEFFLRDLSRESKVSLATTYRIIAKMVKLGLVSREEKAKTTEYKIIKDTPIYSRIYGLVIGEKPDARSILKKLVSDKLADIKLFVMKGSKKKVFFVGPKPDVSIIKTMLEEVYKQTEEKLDALTVDDEQFTSMVDMGLLKDLVQL